MGLQEKGSVQDRALYRDYYLSPNGSVVWVFLISSFYPGETRLTEFKAKSVRDAREMPWAGDGAGDSKWSISSRRCLAAGHQTTRSSLGSLPNHAQQIAVLIGNFLVPFHLEAHPVHPFLLSVSPFWGGIHQQAT